MLNTELNKHSTACANGQPRVWKQPIDPSACQRGVVRGAESRS